MKKLLAGFFFIFLCHLSASAQSGVVKGTVKDTAENKILQHAVISLLNASDSTLSQFTRSNEKGQFVIENVQPGSYVLLITFPKFADLADKITVPADGLDVNTIALTSKATLLSEVIVRSGSAIRIKGDTTEFTADSFVVREGATVEELLKKLPGFQVNSKGEITAQGKRVEKVLVDGEEFFGDDPTMATQNLSAKAVDKVQLFDNKTDQQQLTGITNGSEGKTLNIKLKEDKKKGAFGKVNAGTDFTDYIDTKALYNKFVGKKKLSAYATKSNISTGSLNWEDRQKLGIENDYEYDEIGGYYYSFGNDDGFNDWSLRGLPSSYTAGGLFINKWNADKQSVNTSYRFNWLRTFNNGITLSQNILPNSITYRNTYTQSQGLNQQHALNGKYEWKIDSLASLKLTMAGINKTTSIFDTTYGEFLDMNKVPRNISRQRRENESLRTQLDNQLLYRQAFKKANRLLMTTLRLGITRDAQDGMNYSKIDFYNNGLIDSVGLVDQMRTFDGESKTLGAKVTFNEPLSIKWNLVFDVAHNRNISNSYRNTFSQSGNGKYETIDPLYSNNFDLTAISNSSNVVARYVYKKVKLAFGSGLSGVKLNLLDIDSNRRTSYDFLNVTPQAQLGYTFKPQTSVSVNYRGTTRQPTINQLQPLRDNNDPLNVFVGNPDLEVGFNHSLSMFFNQYKVLSGRGIWISFSYNIMENAISNYTLFDLERGKQIHKPINVNGNRNWNFWADWNKYPGEKKLNYGFNASSNGGVNNTLVNQHGRDEWNRTRYANYNAGFSVGYEESEKKSFNIRPNVGYIISQSSLQPDIKNNYFTYGLDGSGFILLPAKLELASTVNVDIQQQFSNLNSTFNQVIWNANIARKVFKDKSGKIILSANDILDQNKGINRVINTNIIQEQRYDRISRYFMLKFEWSFNKMPGSK